MPYYKLSHQPKATFPSIRPGMKKVTYMRVDLDFICLHDKYNLTGLG